MSTESTGLYGRRSGELLGPLTLFGAALSEPGWVLGLVLSPFLSTGKSTASVHPAAGYIADLNTKGPSMASLSHYDSNRCLHWPRNGIFDLPHSFVIW